MKKGTDLESQLFHDQLIKLRKKRGGSIFGEIYDKINLCSDLRSIFYQEKFLKLFKSILKTNEIYLNGFMCRFDFPNDTRNSLSWHQDAPYYMQTFPNFNSGVCWMPVTNNTEENGTLQFIPGSNKKYLRSKYVSKDDHSTSQYFLKISLNKKKK